MRKEVCFCFVLKIPKSETFLIEKEHKEILCCS